MRRVYPLDWPDGQKHSALSAWSPAGCKLATMGEAAERIAGAMNLNVFSKVELSSNVDLTSRGVVYAAEIPKAGRSASVALKFVYGGQTYHVGQDHWGKPRFNAWSLALMTEGLRKVVRHAGENLFERMISGLTALPAPSALYAGASVGWRDVLGLSPNFELGLTKLQTERVIRDEYRARAKEAGQDQARLLVLNTARDAALVEIAG